MNYPMKLAPIFKERIWGGSNLAAHYNKELPAGVDIGESWELADLPQDCSQIVNGSLAGQSLRQALESHAPGWGFSPEQAAFPFGLLIKMLDAQNILSVQVHPDEIAAEQFDGARLKTECWYVLRAEPGATIFYGLNDGVAADDMRQALQDGTVDKLLQAHEVKQGDFFFVPAGTVHALGAGVMVAEIQTPSDTTYRLFDWNRVDDRGRGRELHIEQALASIHFQAKPSIESDTEEGACLMATAQELGHTRKLVDCPYFCVALTEAPGAVESTQLDRPAVVTVLQGHGQMQSANGDNDNICVFQAGDTILVPSMKTLDVMMNEPCVFLWSCLGPVKVV